jgi:hypothetical protein
MQASGGVILTGVSGKRGYSRSNPLRHAGNVRLLIGLFAFEPRVGPHEDGEIVKYCRAMSYISAILVVDILGNQDLLHRL